MSAVAARLDVWPDGADESTLLVVKPRDVLVWEKENPRRSAQQLGDDAWKLEYLYEVAWTTLGKPGGDLDAWSKTTDVTWHQPTATTPQEDNSPGPTNAEAPTES